MMAVSETSGMLRRVARASLAVLAAQAIFKLASLLQAAVMAPWVDRGVYDVVYAFAFEGVIFTFFMIGEEVIAPSFLPLFMRRRDEHGEAAAWHFASLVLTWQTLLLAASAAAIMLAPGAVIRALTAWSPDTHPRQWALARQSLVWLAPSLIGLSLGTTTYMLLNGYRRFFLAAFGDASWKFCVLFCVLFGMGWLGLDHRVLLVGLLLGSAAKLATHLAGLRRELRWVRPAIQPGGSPLREMLILMAPLMGGVVFAKIRDLYNNVTVLTHLDTPGLLMANSFGRKMVGTVGWLVPYAVSVAVFPFFCELADQRDRRKFGDLISQAVRLLLAVFIPVSLLCVALSSPVTRLLFERGRFTADMARWTALSMACYALVLPGQAIEYLLMKAFFAQRKMVSVVVAGFVFSALSMAVSGLGIRLFGLHGGAALAVVALGFSVTRILKSAALIGLLKRGLPCLAARETLQFILRVTAVSSASAAAAYLLVRLIAHLPIPGRVEVALLVQLAAGLAAALAVFWPAAWIAGLREPFVLVRWIVTRWNRREHSDSEGRPPAESGLMS